MISRIKEKALAILIVVLLAMMIPVAYFSSEAFSSQTLGSGEGENIDRVVIMLRRHNVANINGTIHTKVDKMVG